MKTFLLIFILISLTTFANSRIEDCKCKEKTLCGKVFVTESTAFGDADFIVFIDNEHPDLWVNRVGLLSYFTCGQWHFTNMRGNADFVIVFTNNKYTADFTIGYKDY
ncbi:MAG: hypothetical protein LBT27_05480 [Prevotellaceae bacterium]|jgi:hypothetical protein|nr:hypothetical protein [Prevotellaceae bacterium]